MGKRRMKLKKVFSGMLAIVLCITLLPSNAFATVSNNVTESVIETSEDTQRETEIQTTEPTQTEETKSEQATEQTTEQATEQAIETSVSTEENEVLSANRVSERTMKGEPLPSNVVSAKSLTAEQWAAINFSEGNAGKPELNEVTAGQSEENYLVETNPYDMSFIKIGGTA